MLCSTACRASANCSVISANDRVNPPSSSLPCNIPLGLTLPPPTSPTPSPTTTSHPAKLLLALQHRLGAQVAGGHLAHPFGQHQQWPDQLLAQQHGQQHGAEN